MGLEGGACRGPWGGAGSGEGVGPQPPERTLCRQLREAVGVTTHMAAWDVCWPRAGAFAVVVKNSVSTLGTERATLTKSSHHHEK